MRARSGGDYNDRVRLTCVPLVSGVLLACGTATPTVDPDPSDAGPPAGDAAFDGEGGGGTGGAPSGGAGGGFEAGLGGRTGPAVDAGAVGNRDATGGPTGDAAGGPTGDAAATPVDARLSDALAADAVPAPTPDAGEPGPPGRVCCLADADCAPGQHCSAGRCFDAPPAGPCGCAADADCPGDQLCLTDDRICGACVPRALGCEPACERDLGRAPFAYLAPDPLMPARPMAYTGTLALDERLPGGVGRAFELALEDGARQRFAYVLPGQLTLPFQLGERMVAEFSGLQGDAIDGRAVLSGPEGVRLAVVNRRGGEPTEVLGLPFHIEYLGCSPTLIGNCLQASPATLVFDVGGPRSPVAQTGDTVRVAGWTVAVARIYRDENACQPEVHDLYANFVMVPVRP